MIAAAFVLAFWVLPSTARNSDVRFDIRGSALLAAGLGSFVFAINRAPTWGWGDPIILALLAASPLFLWAFVAQERRCPYPLIPVRYFQTRNFTAPILGQILVSTAYQVSPAIRFDRVASLVVIVGFG